MKFLRILATLVATIFLLIPMSATAEEITISFEADVNWDVIHPDVRECLGLAPGVTDTISGIFIYSTLDEYGQPVLDMDDDPEEFFTTFTTPPNSVIVEVGEFWFKSNPDEIKISFSYYDREEGEGIDSYGFNSQSNITDSACGVFYIELDITDADGNAIDLDWPVEIPTTAPDLDVWIGAFRHIGVETSFGGVYGQLTLIERVYLVDDIAVALATLLENNPLDAEQETGLYQKVASALDKFDRDKVDQGCQQLSAFICQLEALLPIFEQNSDFDLATAILNTAYEIFGDQCSDPNLHVMECPMEDW